MISIVAVVLIVSAIVLNCVDDYQTLSLCVFSISSTIPLPPNLLSFFFSNKYLLYVYENYFIYAYKKRELDSLELG